MKTAAVLLLGMLGLALFCSVSCNNPIRPDNCCFNFHPGRISKQLIKSYCLTDNRCSPPAVILKTNNDLMVCVDPNQSWVKQVMQSLDQKSFMHGWDAPTLECRGPSSVPKYPNTPTHRHANTRSHQSTIPPSYVNTPTPKYMCIPTD